MPKYIMSGKEYLVQTPEELLEQIKDESPFTKDLSLQAYIDNVAANVINSMTQYHITAPAKAKNIVEIWEKIGMVEVVN